MTKPRQEYKAVANMQQQAYRVYLPNTPKRDQFGAVLGFEPLFPGYCFCAANPQQSLAPLRSTPGVLSVVRFGQQVAYIDAPTMSRITKAAAYLSENPIDAPIQAGDKVKIVEGPLAGLEGLASNIRQERVEVLIAMMGRHQRLRCERDQITKV